MLRIGAASSLPLCQSPDRMKKRVLLTGATGFVGRQILVALCKADVDLLLVVRDGSESRLPLPCCGYRIHEDLFKESADWWAAVCQSVDVVIHAAWYEPKCTCSRRRIWIVLPARYSRHPDA